MAQLQLRARLEILRLNDFVVDEDDRLVVSVQQASVEENAGLPVALQLEVWSVMMVMIGLSVKARNPEGICIALRRVVCFALAS